MNKILIFIILFLFSNLITAQNENAKISDAEIFIIDSYVTPEEPFKVKITFFTSDSVSSLIRFENGFEFSVSEKLSDEHKFEILLDSLVIDTTVISYIVVVTDSFNHRKESETYDLYLPGEYDLKIKDKNGILNICLGSIIFIIPSPTMIDWNGNTYFSLTKELPIISFYGRGYNYPKGYIGLEYSYIFNSVNRNYLRFGYKHIFQTKIIKYIAPGLNYTTNFKGFDGISPEISVGLFKFYDVFTFYLKYRYNFEPTKNFDNFHEFSIGLFTSTISFNL